MSEEPKTEPQDDNAEEKETSPTPEAEDFKIKYLRQLAEMENARKRMQKERHELTQYAVEGLLTEFLHPLDHFEKALGFAENMSDEVRNWAVGFEMILNQFKQVLENHGVTPYDSVGKKFDPHLHEAMEMEESTTTEPGVILEEFVRGYKMNDRAIRVARVKVAKAPSKKESKQQQEEESSNDKRK